MTLMLASVNCLEEADLALASGADLIDLKQPAQGALGALELAVVEGIVAHCQMQRPVSATIGDLPMQPDRVFAAVNAMAGTGVDFIKIGFFPGGDWPGTMRKLSTLAEHGLALIAVLFADSEPDFTIIDDLQRSGFRGVMLDTQGKRNGSLTEIMPPVRIEGFVDRVKWHGMLCGLAGSLRICDIAPLTALQPDYLGFRGALCRSQDRTAPLDRSAMIAVKNAIAKFSRSTAYAAVE